MSTGHNASIIVGDRLFDNSSCCDCDCQLRIHSLLPLIPASKQWGELLRTWNKRKSAFFFLNFKNSFFLFFFFVVIVSG